MRTQHRLRIWFWILAVPFGVVVLLTGLLRSAAEQADAEQTEQAIREQELAANVQARERAEQAAQARAEHHQQAAQRCGRLTRSMWESPPPGPLLIVVTRNECRYGCELLLAAQDHLARLAETDLRGSWVQPRSPPRPPQPGFVPSLRPYVIADCAAFLTHRNEDFLLLGGDGQLLDIGLDAQNSEPGQRLDPHLALKRSLDAALFGR